MPIGVCPTKAHHPPGGHFPGGPQTFPTNQWVTLIDWTGVTLELLPFRVTVTAPLGAGGGPPDAVVKWRRFGIGAVPFSQGSFKQQVDLNIYPSDTKLKIEVWVDEPDLEIAVTFLDP